ncbi:hypothetical protein ABEW34_15865 [Paenibacillus algorifonticola]|uniref:hypothetical protein n=1 Tax=Paenibacillus algorifonticola TaxID=684063 RepID=UPI003D2B51D3
MLFWQLDKRFDQVDTQLDQMNTRLDQIQIQLERMEDSQNDDVIGILRHTHDKVSLLNQNVASLKQDVEYIVKEQSIIKLEIERLKHKQPLISNQYKNVLDDH